MPYFMYILIIYAISITILYFASKAETMRVINDCLIKVAAVDNHREQSDQCAIQLCMYLGVAHYIREKLELQIRELESRLDQECNGNKTKMELLEFRLKVALQDIIDYDALLKLKDNELNELEHHLDNSNKLYSEVKAINDKLELAINNSHKLVSLRDKDIDLLNGRIQDLQAEAQNKSDIADKIAEEYLCFRGLVNDFCLAEILKRVREQIRSPLPSESYAIIRACNVKPAS